MTERLESERAELVALADRIETHINYGTSLIIHLSDQKALLTALRRSSQSTSDAGGGVREEEQIDRLRLTAFKSNDASDRQAYFDAVSKWFQDRHYRRMPALSKPAPVAANASAEARLREVLEFYAREWQTNMEGDSETPGLSRCWREPTDNLLHDEGVRAREALSAHPHASDCDKTTYDVLGDQRTCVGVPASGIAKMMAAIENPPQPNEALKKLMRDHASDCEKQGETTKSEGGLNRQARNPVGLPDGSGDLASAGGIARDDITDHHRQVGCDSPSDRPADVTVEELADFLYDNGCIASGDDEEEGLARALLDAFTVGRR